jgi:phage terminase large subunit
VSEESRQISAEFPPKLIGPLFDRDARYKIFYGGRGGSKSWSIVRALLIQGISRPLRILCVREFMSSVADSVHKLLADQIQALGLSDHYTVEKASIFAANGTEFRFAGIRNNVSAIKSFEAVDIAFVEEASNVSATSWSILIPTIRKAGSQIWLSFNPELASDDTFQRFIVHTPPNSIVVKINYDENPWFPEVLQAEAEHLKETDPDAYNNIYLGFPKVFLENAIYGKELRIAQEENRIGKVPYDPLLPVHRFWDLGWRDQSAVTMAQTIGFETHIIDYLQGSQKTIHEYLKILQAKPYIFGVDFLPHDAKAKQLGSGKSIEEIMRSTGCKVQIVPRLSVEDGINATRMMFANTWIDEVKCADLIQCLRKYRYDITGARPTPIHDDASHGADSVRYCAISLRAPKADPMPPKLIVPKASDTAWMS